MSDRPYRFRFGLRLVLLSVGLLAVCLAWWRAVEDRHRSERAILRANLETQLTELERGRAANAGSSDPRVTQHFPRLDRDIVNLREKLKALEP